MACLIQSLQIRFGINPTLELKFKALGLFHLMWLYISPRPGLESLTKGGNFQKEGCSLAALQMEGAFPITEYAATFMHANAHAHPSAKYG